MTEVRIGVDLGGTKIEALGLDRQGRELFRKRVPTPRDSYEAIVDAVASLVRDVDAACSSEGSVGVGIPGIVSPASGLVKNANTTLLIGHPLDGDLASRLGRPVRVANDANCFALSEATDGAASPEALGVESPIVFGVILGTGTGGGVVVDGSPLVGPDAVAGEWGHNPLPWQTEADQPAPACWCGHSGCIETYLSGPALARDHERRAGEVLSAPEIASRAVCGDAAAGETLDRYCHRLARALASIVNVLNPHAIVLGGGVSNVEPLYERVPRIWGDFIFSDTVSTRLVRARHGDSSGVRGAAWLWSSA